MVVLSRQQDPPNLTLGVYHKLSVKEYRDHNYQYLTSVQHWGLISVVQRVANLDHKALAKGQKWQLVAEEATMTDR